MEKESLFEKIKANNWKGSEKFEPKFSWKLRFWSWLQSIRIRIATNSYKNDKTKFGSYVS